MAAWEIPLIAALLFVTLALLLYLARRRRRLGTAFVAVTALLAGAWMLARLAVRSDYHDADGYVDCWPRCTALQDAVALATWYGPLLFIALGVLAAVLAAITGPRGGSHDANAVAAERDRASQLN